MNRATVTEDGGRASSGIDFFRCPVFLEAEGVTHTIEIGEGNDRIAGPLVAREIPGGGLDATSPYGYPGFSLADVPENLPLDISGIDFSGTGLVSIFIRHCLDPDGEPPLTGATARNVCLVADPALPPKSRMSDRQQVRKNEKKGYSVRIVPGEEVAAGELDGFTRVYTETMERTGASERYFFDADYFRGLLGSGMAWLALAEDGDGEIAAGSLVVNSDGLLHYYLSGTGDSHLSDSPMKSVLSALVGFSADRETALNLGGGITPGDRLEEFKRGFGNREVQWYTQEIVCDPDAYRELSEGKEAGEYFPAYRAP
ncbi:MAG: GNAT family N-acetyltransferase [Solirubrobacterales bacterium]